MRCQETVHPEMKGAHLENENLQAMSTRRYASLVSAILALLFGGLLVTDQVLICLDQLSRANPYRIYPPLSEIGPFVPSWGMGDAVYGSFPALAYIHQAVQAGQAPWWNPLEGLGMPSIASMGLGYAFPVHWLTYGLLHPLLAWHVELFCVLMLSSVSCFALFRRFTGSGKAACFGATAWTFGGWSAAYLQLPAYAWTLSLFPFTLLAIERIRDGERWSYLQLGVALALLFTGGHLQLLIPCLALIALWSLWRAKARLVSLSLTIAAGALMSLYHLLPMIELLRLSERETLPLSTILKLLMLPREFLGMVIPTLMGQPSDNFYFGSLLAHPVINGREHCVFSGVVTLLLALVAARRGAFPSSRPIAGMIALGFVLAGSPWLYGTLCKLFPPLLFLTPTRFLPFALFGLCFLATQAWASLEKHPLKPSEGKMIWGVLAIFLTGALYYILPAMVYSQGFQEWLHSMAVSNYMVKPPYFEGDFSNVFVARVLDHFSLTSPTLATSFFVMLASAILFGSHTNKSLPFKPLFLVLCLDLFVFFAAMNLPSPQSAYFPSNPDIDYLKQQTTLSEAPRPPLRVMSLGGGPGPNLLLVEGISNFEAYESAHPGDYRQLLAVLNGPYDFGHQGAQYFGEEFLEDGLLDLLGIGIIYDSAARWDGRYGPAEHLKGLAAQRRPNVLRAFLLNTYSTADRPTSFKAILEPGFNPRAQVLLNTAPSYPSPPRASFQTIEPTLYSPQEVRFQVTPENPTLLVLNDLHYPGWRVFVDGQPRELLKAYGFARAVELKPGDSEVVFRFRPTGFPYTPWLALSVFGLLLGLEAWRRRRPSEKDEGFPEKPLEPQARYG